MYIYIYIQWSLFSYITEQNCVVCWKMDRTEYNHFWQNKADSERQLLHVFSHTWNLVSFF
jgi:hypothetical protein